MVTSESSMPSDSRYCGLRRSSFCFTNTPSKLISSVVANISCQNSTISSEEDFVLTLMPSSPLNSRTKTPNQYGAANIQWLRSTNPSFGSNCTSECLKVSSVVHALESDGPPPLHLLRNDYPQTFSSKQANVHRPHAHQSAHQGYHFRPPCDPDLLRKYARWRHILSHRH